MHTPIPPVALRACACVCACTLPFHLWHFARSCVFVCARVRALVQGPQEEGAVYEGQEQQAVVGGWFSCSKKQAGIVLWPVVN